MFLLSGTNWMDLFQNLPTDKIVTTLGRFAIVTALLFAVMLVCEFINGVDFHRYLTRNFLTDLLYRFFYTGGVYTALFYSPLLNLARVRLAFLDVEIVHRMPLAASLLVYWLSLDLLNYWVHRFQHTRFWWRFHTIHHSQDVLTFTASHRFHVVDQLLAHVLSLTPALVLGVPIVAWIPYTFLLSFIDALHHSGLTWTLGPLRFILVSPVFHGVHHSTEATHCHRNYGGIFVFWDYLFGTALDAKERPARAGLDGWNVPESVIDHFFAPFRRLTYPGATPPRPELGSSAPSLASLPTSSPSPRMPGATEH